MQTFLPFPDYYESARSLDNKRLSNQRRESFTLLRGGWRFHPAAKMWWGYGYQLTLYSLAICDECIIRGYSDSRHLFWPFLELSKTESPWWLGMEEFHKAHRASLLQKFPAFYGDLLGWTDVAEGYIWPEGRTSRRLRRSDRF